MFSSIQSLHGKTDKYTAHLIKTSKFSVQQSNMPAMKLPHKALLPQNENCGEID